MKKVLAVLRSLILLGFVVLVLYNTPGDVFGSPDSMVQARRLQGLWKTAWVAVGWLAIECAIAWFQALRNAKAPKAPKADKGADKEPPSPGPDPAAVKPEVEGKQK